MAEATCAPEPPARCRGGSVREAGATDGRTDGRKATRAPAPGRAVGEMPGPPALLLLLLLLLAAGGARAVPLPQTGAGERPAAATGLRGPGAGAGLRGRRDPEEAAGRAGLGAEDSEGPPGREARGSERGGRLVPPARAASPGPKRGRGDAVGAGRAAKGGSADPPPPGRTAVLAPDLLPEGPRPASLPGSSASLSRRRLPLSLPFSQ